MTLCQSVFLAMTGKAPDAKQLAPEWVFAEDGKPRRKLTPEEQAKVDQHSFDSWMMAMRACYGR